jgi:hypothetical protein
MQCRCSSRMAVYLPCPDPRAAGTCYWPSPSVSPTLEGSFQVMSPYCVYVNSTNVLGTTLSARTLVDQDTIGNIHNIYKFTCAYILTFTHTHTRMHTHISHTHVHAFIFTHTYMNTQTFTNIHVHTHNFTHTHMYTHIFPIHMCLHVPLPIHICIRTHLPIHTCMHTPLRIT